MPVQLSASIPLDESIRCVTIARKDGRIRNELLRALPGSVLGRIRPYLKTVWISSHEVQFDAGAHVGHIYFPETAVISLAMVLRAGGDVQIGTVGREGMVGLSVALGSNTSSTTASSQIAGTARRMSVQHLTPLLDREPHFRRAVLGYAQAFLSQTAQTTACNGAHLVEERCARWLLATRDRMDGDAFLLSAERLADTLGVRRAGVIAAMRGLQDAGLIHCERDEITVRDPAGLERVSCECYRVVRTGFDRLFTPRA